MNKRTIWYFSNRHMLILFNVNFKQMQRPQKDPSQMHVPKIVRKKKKKKKKINFVSPRAFQRTLGIYMQFMTGTNC